MAHPDRLTIVEFVKGSIPVDRDDDGAISTTVPSCPGRPD
jgi:hypothetical protein